MKNAISVREAQRLQASNKSLRNRVAKYRGSSGPMEMARNAGGVGLGAVASGAIEAQFGDGMATIPGVVIGVAGAATGYVDAVNLGLGLLAPAIARKSKETVLEWKAKAAAKP